MKPNPTVRSASGRRQRGIAILMSLGILALLMVLAIGFVFTSRTERNAAAANTDQITARQFTEHGVRACTGYIKYFYQYAGCANYNSAGAKAGLYPASTTPQPPGTAATTAPFMQMATGPWAGRCYASSLTNGYTTDSLDSALSLALRDSSGTTTSAYFAPPTVPDRITWLPMHTTIGGVNNYMFGRLAYMVIDESGKIDPNGVICQSQLDASTGFACDADNNQATTGLVAEAGKSRLGNTPKEINLNNAFPGISGDDFRTKLGTNPVWTSWQHIYSAAAATTQSMMQLKADKSDYNTRLSPIAPSTIGETIFDVFFPYSYDIEAWYAKKGSPNSIPATVAEATTYGQDCTDYHRFDLARTDWNSMTVDKLVNSGTLSEFWDTTVTPAKPTTTTTDRLAWLAVLKGDSGDAAKDATIRNQVAANIIDYCRDSSQAITTDYAAATGDPKAAGYAPASATYVGLKAKTPCINKIAMTWTLTRGAGAGLPPKYPYTLTLSMDAELVNPYNVPTDAGSLAVDLQFTGGMPTAAQAPAGVTVNPSATASQTGARLTFSYGAIAAKSYSKQTQTVTYTWSSIAITPPAINVTYLGAAFTVGGLLRDFSEITRNAATLPSFTIALAVPSPGWFGVSDPRANTFNSDWTWTAGAAAPATGNGAISNPSTFGGVAGYIGDTETATDPINLSTAYVAGRPIRTLWELGCIHRGEKWRTINLKKCGTDGSYAGGDAAILDQVKIGPFSTVRGKVNPNSRSQYVWNALASDVHTGWAYSDIGGGANPGTAVNMTTAWPLIYAHHITSGTVLGSRGEAAEFLATLTPTATTDAAKEELAGKLANLLSTRQTYFTVIVTGQSTRQLPGSIPNDPSVLYGQMGPAVYFRVRGEQKIVAIVYRDAYTNKYRVERFYYVDE
jgi:hypothetical protein